MANSKPTKRLRACYGGPYDGQHRSENFPPLGYRPFKVRHKMVWLWKGMRIERIDFDTLSKAARKNSVDYNPEELEAFIEERGNHLEPQ